LTPVKAKHEFAGLKYFYLNDMLKYCNYGPTLKM